MVEINGSTLAQTFASLGLNAATSEKQKQLFQPKSQPKRFTIIRAILKVSYSIGYAEVNVYSGVY